MKSTPFVPSHSYDSVPSVNTVKEDLPAASPLWNIAFVCALAGIFILYSRFLDFIGNGLFIPRIVLSLMTLFFLLTGRPLIFLRSVPGKFLLVLIVWISITM